MILMADNKKYINEMLYHSIPMISIGVLFISVFLFGILILEPFVMFLGIIGVVVIRDDVFMHLFLINKMFRYVTMFVVIFNAFVLYFSKAQNPEYIFLVFLSFPLWVAYFIL